ncbi:MAG: hypothetical protein JWP58_2083 [Hymenobacter sp.]|nr:hypothetical protein [Hymenobacter sp.]
MRGHRGFFTNNNQAARTKSLRYWGYQITALSTELRVIRLPSGQPKAC